MLEDVGHGQGLFSLKWEGTGLVPGHHEWILLLGDLYSYMGNPVSMHEPKSTQAISGNFQLETNN